MSLHQIYSRYAKSLIEISQENGILDKTIEDSYYFKEVAKNKDFQNLLKNPVFKPEMKLKVFEALFKGKVGDTFYKFINLVTKKGREMYLPAIIDELLFQDKKNRKITDAKLTTAVEVPKDFVEELKALLLKSSIADKEIDIKTKVDKDILGGFVVEVGGSVVDASVRTKLNNIRKNITEENYVRKI